MKLTSSFKLLFELFKIHDKSKIHTFCFLSLECGVLPGGYLYNAWKGLLALFGGVK
jgi:hypothetical protein